MHFDLNINKTSDGSRFHNDMDDPLEYEDQNERWLDKQPYEKLSLYDQLRQDKRWRTRDGDVLLVAEMEPSHARNVVAYLERRALRIQCACFGYALTTLGTINGEMALEMIEQEIDREFEDEPEVWLAKMPLIKALKARGKVEGKGLLQI